VIRAKVELIEGGAFEPVYLNVNTILCCFTMDTGPSCCTSAVVTVCTSISTRGSILTRVKVTIVDVCFTMDTGPSWCTRAVVTIWTSVSTRGSILARFGGTIVYVCVTMDTGPSW